jgi:hypothetical protein
VFAFQSDQFAMAVAMDTDAFTLSEVANAIHMLVDVGRDKAFRIETMTQKSSTYVPFECWFSPASFSRR